MGKLTKLTIEEKTYISEVVKYFVKQGVEITSVVKTDEDGSGIPFPLANTELFFFSNDGRKFRFGENRLYFNGLTKFRQYEIKDLLEEEDE